MVVGQATQEIPQLNLEEKGILIGVLPRRIVAEAFTKENRVKLYYKVCESLPPPTSSEYGPEGGDGLYKLDELLRKHFGRLSLASGGRIETVILNFILSAPEDELLTLIEFIPGTHIIAQVERHNGFMYSAHVRY